MVDPRRLRLYLATLQINERWAAGYEDEAFGFAYHLVHYRDLIVPARQIWQALVNEAIGKDVLRTGFYQALQRRKYAVFGPGFNPTTDGSAKEQLINPWNFIDSDFQALKAKVDQGVAVVGPTSAIQRAAGTVGAGTSNLGTEFSASPYGQTLKRWYGDAGQGLSALSTVDKAFGSMGLVALGGLVKRFYPELVNMYGVLARVKGC